MPTLFRHFREPQFAPYSSKIHYSAIRRPVESFSASGTLPLYAIPSIASSREAVDDSRREAVNTSSIEAVNTSNTQPNISIP